MLGPLPPPPLLPFAPFAPAGSTAFAPLAPAPPPVPELNVIGMLLLVVLFTRWLVRCCWELLDVPEVVEAPEALPLELFEVEPEVEVEVDPEVCALAGRPCSASDVTASAAKLKRAFMVGDPDETELKCAFATRRPRLGNEGGGSTR